MSFHEDIILSLEQMEKGEIESLIFQCYESSPSVRIIFKMDTTLSKAYGLSRGQIKKEIRAALNIGGFVSWKESSCYDFVLDYVEKSFHRYISKGDFSNSVKKEILFEIIEVAKEVGMQIQEPYHWFEKLEEMADFYNNHYAAPGESIDPHP